MAAAGQQAQEGQNKATFIELAIRCQVLRFGRFELKSGRISPYFFNAGLFSSGRSLAALGRCYAQTVVDQQLEPAVIFGPAYKGIPLAAATTVALSDQHGLDIPYAYNRKERKDHGEGGQLVGATLAGDVVIVDDVITAGTAIREAVQMINEAGARPAAVVIGLDRCERGSGSRSAVEEVRQELDMVVASVITMHDIIAWLESSGDMGDHLKAMQRYRDEYGV